MRFQHCSLSFRLTSEVARKLLQARNAEVTGSIQRDGSQVYFEVTDAQSQPTDLEQYRAREAALKKPTPQEWYDLGRWAKDRADFYNDTDLKEAWLECLVRGVGTELTQLSASDHEGRFKLASRAEEMGFPARLADELRHESFQNWWLIAGSLAKPDVTQLAAILARLKTIWPEALKPISAFPTELSEAYLLQPVDSYRAATDSQRQTMRRMFAVEVILRQLQLERNPDGSNGEQLAERLVELVPERRQLAEAYRDAALSHQLAGMTQMSRADAVELSRKLSARNRQRDATEGLLRWMVAREQRVRPETAPEYIELADDYLNLLHDEGRAISLLTEAHRREPESIDVQTRFGQLGYIFNGVKWIKPKTMPLPSADPAATAPPGQLATGMTMQELKLMMGEPTSRSRVMSASRTEELWLYGQPNESSRLVIELRRPSLDEPYRVTQFFTQSRLPSKPLP